MRFSAKLRVSDPGHYMTTFCIRMDLVTSRLNGKKTIVKLQKSITGTQIEDIFQLAPFGIQTEEKRLDSDSVCEIFFKTFLSQRLVPKWKNSQVVTLLNHSGRKESSPRTLNLSSKCRSKKTKTCSTHFRNITSTVFFEIICNHKKCLPVSYISI